MKAIRTHYSHYPFGMQMPGRSNSYGTGVEYRYAYNGKELDNEVSGNGNSYDYGNRMYEPRIGRFLSMDKFAGAFPNQSPYIFAGNSPIMFTDFNGDFKIIVTKEALKAAGMTKIEIKRFQSVVSDLNLYLKQNPNVITVIHKMTGLSEAQILEHSIDGKGPTIYITVQDGGAQAPRNRVDVSTKNVTDKDGFEIDYTLIQWFEEYKDKSDDAKAALDLILGDLVLHEYTHWGDRKTNDGKVTGQNPVDPGDDPNYNGKQNTRSKAPLGGHRGTDTDMAVTGSGISISGDATYDEKGKRTANFHFTESDIMKVQNATTRNPKPKGEPQKSGGFIFKKRRLPKDMDRAPSTKDPGGSPQTPTPRSKN